LKKGREQGASRKSFMNILLIVLQCYRRQSIPMEQAKIRPFVTLYSLYRSLPNLVWLTTSANPTKNANLSWSCWYKTWSNRTKTRPIRYLQRNGFV